MLAKVARGSLLLSCADMLYSEPDVALEHGLPDVPSHTLVIPTKWWPRGCCHIFLGKRFGNGVFVCMTFLD